MQGETRRKEIREIQKKYHWFYALILGAVLLVIGIWVGASVFAEDDSNGYGMNLFTEALGIAASVIITVLAIDRINERRAQERQTQELKERLVRDAGSRSNDIAVHAVEQLRAEGWLTGNDGLLKGVRLAEADLRNANLRLANLQEADLWKTNLQEADLWSTNLQGASLIQANLQKAALCGADFENADLRAANLRGADLSNASLKFVKLIDANLQEATLYRVDLRRANLWTANLQGAKLDDAKLHGLFLPDEVRYTDGIDMKKYTEPDHPDFSETLRKIDKIRNAV